jgi:transposase InsO family protein
VLQQFVDYYNHERYHESLNNLLTAGVFYSHGSAILEQHEMSNRVTLAACRKIHYATQAGQ